MDLTNNDIQKRYHMIQSLTLLTQLLTQQEACHILAAQSSPHNIVPLLIDVLSSFPAQYDTTHPQMFKLLASTILKTLEPFL